MNDCQLKSDRLDDRLTSNGIIIGDWELVGLAALNQQLLQDEPATDVVAAGEGGAEATVQLAAACRVILEQAFALHR